MTDLNRGQKIQLCKITISMGIFLLLKIFPVDPQMELYLYLLAYLPIGYDVVLDSFNSMKNGRIFDENFLMIVATIGAFILGEYSEGVFVMWLFNVGEFFESIAVGSSKKSIQSLIDYSPDEARVVVDGQDEVVWPEDVQIGETIKVLPGEKIPIDGVVINGTSTVNMAFLTGESVPVDVEVGDDVLSGSINLSGVLEIETTKDFEDSAVSRIMTMIEESSEKKSVAENFITKFAKVYTPTVVFFAIGLAIIPNLIWEPAWAMWIHRALIFLVVSCPCALMIAIPLSFFGGIGKGSRRGILIKGSSYIESLSNVETIAFDKTGTLSEGVFNVVEIINGSDEDQWIKIASAVESSSNHPIARSIVDKYGTELVEAMKDIREIHGQGMSGIYKEKSVLVGNDTLLESHDIEYEKVKTVGTQVHVAIDGIYCGTIIVGDEVRPSTKEAIERLKALNIKDLAIVTGDKVEVGEDMGEKIGIDQVYGDLLPDEKLLVIEDMISKDKGSVVYVGDGINDGPVLTRADVGVAMGGVGSDVAVESADIVLMDDNLLKLPEAVEISKKTMSIVRQNIIFTLVVKFGTLFLSTIGMATMGMAIFADTGVLLIAILNAMRAMK